LNLKPEIRAQALANQGEAERLVDEGKDLGQKGNFEESFIRFQAASRLDPSLKLDPESEAKKLASLGLLSQMEGFSAERKFPEAVAAYTKAITLDPNVKISSDSLNGLCWDGSLNGFAKAVLPACEKAVALAPQDVMIRDSRGLARGLTGNTKGAIEDFQAFIAQTDDKKDKLQRQRWVKALSAGNNPFTPEELGSAQDVMIEE
jgi:tetratricopeptide (TPR) repeat protein